MKHTHSGFSVAMLLCIGVIPIALAQQTKEDQEWEKLFEGDFEEQALQVNEGQLEFLSTRPADKPIHTVT